MASCPGVPVRAVNQGHSWSLTVTTACTLTCGTAGRRPGVRSLPSWCYGESPTRIGLPLRGGRGSRARGYTLIRGGEVTDVGTECAWVCLRWGQPGAEQRGRPCCGAAPATP